MLKLNPLIDLKKVLTGCNQANNLFALTDNALVLFLETHKSRL